VGELTLRDAGVRPMRRFARVTVRSPTTPLSVDGVDRLLRKLAYICAGVGQCVAKCG
jgi:hypothetical protein